MPGHIEIDRYAVDRAFVDTGQASYNTGFSTSMLSSMMIAPFSMNQDGMRVQNQMGEPTNSRERREYIITTVMKVRESLS